MKRSRNPSVAEELSEDEAASASNSACSTPKKAAKEPKKRKGEESPPSSHPRQDSPVPCVKKAKTAKDNNAKDLAFCR